MSKAMSSEVRWVQEACEVAQGKSYKRRKQVVRQQTTKPKHKRRMEGKKINGLQLLYIPTSTRCLQIEIIH